jgi:nucleoside-diphosphate-sugar epimerase
MRIFFAGATGVIGRELLPMLVAAGHEVTAISRSEGKLAALEEAGATAVLADAYDAEGLREAAVAARPELVMHQLTDLPDDAAEIGDAAENARIRDEGTANLIAAARAAGAERLLAQSIAWTPRGGDEGREAFEAQVLDFGGVVLRYGQFYGPGTYYEDVPPEPPRVTVPEAARRTLNLLEAPSGVVEIVEG